MTIHPLFRGAALAALLTLAPVLRAADSNPTQDRADRFLMLVNASYQAIAYVESEAQWKALTDVSDVHDAASETAGKARAAFMGNPAVINETKALLLQRHDLKDLSIRELERILLIAAESPMTKPELTKARIEAETALWLSGLATMTFVAVLGEHRPDAVLKKL